MQWNTIESKYLFSKPPWLIIREDKLELPDGRIMPSYYVFEYPDWVSIIAIDRDGKFVMVKQYRHALGEENYELSAGIRDPEDKDMLSTAKRELLEETGYGNGEWKLWMITSANPGTHTNLCHCFLAVGVEKIANQSLDESEDIEVETLDRDQIRQLLENNQIRQSLHAAALWKYIFISESVSRP